MVAKLNIVVVEDNDDLRNLTCQVLHNEGHHAIGLACAEDLEDLGGGKPVDIFLIDINLPGENGRGGLIWYLFSTVSRSGKLRLAARTATKTCPGPGCPRFRGFQRS